MEAINRCRVLGLLGNSISRILDNGEEAMLCLKLGVHGF